MKTIDLRPNISWLGVVDRKLRSFDELFSLPAGTTYNCYLVRGSEKTALIDSVEPSYADALLDKLEALGVTSLDYVVVNHAEQDHSGALPRLLQRYPEARVFATDLAKDLLVQHLELDGEKISAVDDQQTLSLGDQTLRFLHFPWVHWPETMVTYLEEAQLLFTGDLFGCHLAVDEILGGDDPRVPREVRRYYACIMMPYRRVIEGNLPKLAELKPDLIAPSHGPIVTDTAEMLERYRRWVADPPENLAVIPYISMHNSTRKMAEQLAEMLEARGVRTELFNLGDQDMGALAMALVDAATVIFASATVLGGAHPAAASAAFHLNMLRPKIRHASVIGSYGWSTLIQDQLVELMPDLDLDFIDPVVIRGRARPEHVAQLEALAERVARRHGLAEGDDQPSPTAGAAASAPAAPLEGERAQRYRCKKCGWIYDPHQGDPKNGVPPGTAFEDVPANGWFCPLCGVGKSRFTPR